MSYSQAETRRRIVFSLGMLAFSLSGLLIQHFGHVPVAGKSSQMQASIVVSQTTPVTSEDLRRTVVRDGASNSNEPVLLVIQQPSVNASNREHGPGRVLKTNLVALVVPDDNTVLNSYMDKFPRVRLISAGQVPSDREQGRNLSTAR